MVGSGTAVTASPWVSVMQVAHAERQKGFLMPLCSYTAGLAVLFRGLEAGAATSEFHEMSVRGATLYTLFTAQVR